MPSHEFLSKKRVLITGASSGIGELTARFLANKGYSVILVARREENLQKIVESIKSKGGIAEFVVANLGDENERIQLHQRLMAENKLPDILINNAGIGWYGYFSQMGWVTAKEVLSINVDAVVHLTSLFLPSMLDRKYGHVINIGSVAGKLPEQGIAIYSSSKAFLDSFTTILHRELVGTNIHISVLRAGPIKTEFFDSARKKENGGSIPAERMAIPASEVASAVWRLLRFPRKVAYVPFWMVVSPLLEFLFEWLIDLIGPLLLKSKSK
jgi:short-subunit dehydrogenase